VPVQIDGEVVGALPAEFDVVPDALTLRIPRKYLGRAPWTTSR
jgi:diacylglycerol kinase family enzyme